MKEGSGQGPSILAYDAKKAVPDQTSSSQSIQIPDRDASLVPTLQRAVNAARKAEQKVKKVLMEKSERQSQWKSWEAELRRTFTKEKGRYTAALGRLDQEMAEALRQQEQARALLRRAASGQDALQPEENQPTLDLEFDELMEPTPGTRICHRMRFFRGH